MNLANKITIGRIVLIPVFMAFLLSNIPYGEWLAVIFFSLAAVTDGLDGYVARSQKQVTVFGQFLDPMADKLLISAALISLVDLHRLSAWIAMVIIGREFAVSGLRLLALGEGQVIASSRLGKVKTVFQVLAVIAWIIKVNPAYSPGELLLVSSTAWALMGAAIALTLISGLDYYLKSRRLWENQGAENG